MWKFMASLIAEPERTVEKVFINADPDAEWPEYVQVSKVRPITANHAATSDKYVSIPAATHGRNPICIVGQSATLPASVRAQIRTTGTSGRKFLLSAISPITASLRSSSV